MADIKDLLEMTELEMSEVVDAFTKEVNKMRIGSVNVEAVKEIKVEAYGSTVPLYQTASLSAPSAMSLVVTPWDKTLLTKIAGAISEHYSGEINPTVKGESVYVNFPPITKERQKEYLKLIKDLAERYRQRLRDVRNDAKNKIEAWKQDGEITEDMYYKGVDSLDTTIRKYTEKISNLYEQKKEKLS